MARIQRLQKSDTAQNGQVKHSETANGHIEKNTHSHFVKRVCSIPIFKDSVYSAHALASRTSIGRIALSTANSTLTTVADYAAKNQPSYIQSYYQNYLQPHVDKADQIGCKSLDLIESRVPIINKPSSDIIQAVTQPPYQIIDGVKVKIDSTIRSVTEPTYQMMGGVKVKIDSTLKSVTEPTYQMIDGVKIKIDSTFKSVAEPSYQIIDGVKVRIDSTLKSVSYPAHVVVQEANKRLGSAVNTIEHVMDKYLPAETTTTTSTITNKNLDDTTTTTTTTTTTKTSPPHTHTEVDKDANQVKRAYGVIHEASRRIGHMVTTQVNLSTANIPKSREDITRLTETNSYIQTAASQIHVIQETLMNTVNVYGQAAQERLHLISETVQHTTLSMGQQMTHVTDYLQSHSRELPEYLRHGMDSLINNTHEQLDVVRGIYAREDINAFEKTKQVLHNIQTQFVPHLHEIQTQLITYTEVLRQAAEKEFRTPLHYLGLNQKVAA